MRIHRILAFALAAAALLAGCNDRPQTEEILVPDVSESIVADATNQMWVFLKSVLQNLHRGDSLLLLPITSDGGNDVSGQTLRVTAPDIRHRQPLDQDLIDMRTQAAQGLESMRMQFPAEQGTHTDLLGTFQVISEEVLSLPRGHRAVVVVLSDFIQDDAQFNFKSNPRLDSPEHARAFARELAGKTSCPLPGVPMYLGYLQSRDLAPMSRPRREAIQAFWITFLSQQGAHVTVATDGLGSAQSFLDRFEGK